MSGENSPISEVDTPKDNAKESDVSGIMIFEGPKPPPTPDDKVYKKKIKKEYAMEDNLVETPKKRAESVTELQRKLDKISKSVPRD